MGYFVGLMSGTSMDGVDAVLASFSPKGIELCATHTHPMPDPLRQRLEQFVSRQVHDIHELGELDGAIGKLFAEAALQLLASNRAGREILAIGSHGQTVFHAPSHSTPFTLQIGDPSIIAERTGITTIADFRRRDMAAGGQGAPLVPAFHNALFRSTEKSRVVLNIGGIANITILPAAPQQPVRGFDTGPGNTLMDAWIKRHRQLPMDRDGHWAASGTINHSLLERLLAAPYFQLAPPKSSGRELFNLAWLESFGENDTPENIQATLAQLTIESVARAIESHAAATEELFVCGGGAYNPVLMGGIAQRLPAMTVNTTEALGLKPTWVEAAAFAWLAKQTLEGRPGNLPEVTGARHPVVLGAIYPA